MTDEELERLRPPHVTMRAMKVWRYATVTATTGLLIGLALLFGGALDRMVWYLSAAAFVISALAVPFDPGAAVNASFAR